MLIEFSTGNNRSFKKTNTLSMIASSIKDLGDEAIFSNGKLKLLKEVVLYGANGSGKSNFLNSIGQMRWLVLNSSKETLKGDSLGMKPFLLDKKSRKKPTFFEIIFFIGDIKYRYGFEATNEVFVSEWLFESVKIQEKPLFVREYQEITMVNKFAEGERLESKTRPNALFLSVVSQFNGEISNTIISWFEDLNMVHGIQDDQYFGVTAEMLENKKTRNIVLDFMKYADLGINDMKLEELESDFEDIESMLTKKVKNKYKHAIDELKSQKITDVITYHNVFNSKGRIIDQEEFSLTHQESQGTNKFFNIIGAVITVLMHGERLIIDELNARLHPLLTRKIVEIFNSKVGNPNNAQLIFTTHDTNLLDKEIFRRDQVYFTEKDNYGQSHLYSLVEYKPRNDEAYERNYISGKYGAIPFVGDFENLLLEYSK